MYGYGPNHNKLRIHPGENPGFFSRSVPALWGRSGVMGAHGQGEGIFSRALRKLQRKPFKNTSKNINFTQNTKIFA